MHRLLAESQLRQGRADLALEELRLAEANLVAQITEDHDRVALASTPLAVALARRDQRALAAPPWTRSHALLQRRLGEQHP